VNANGRLLLEALRDVMPGPLAAPPDTGASDDAQPLEAARFIPVAGMVVGILAGAVYWLTAQIWPSSVALMLSLLATALVTGDIHRRSGVWLFVLLTKYNVLMALTAANVPIPLPDYASLGLIMVAGHAASRALWVSVMITRASGAARAPAMDLGIALCLGLLPATLLGIPGLVGLAAAISTRLVLTTFVLAKLPAETRMRLDFIQHLTEIGFYLGALAAGRYI
jgi:adenosylcobinamide-GDP ribazoletransferase